jgi:hypothetical protein
MSRSRLTTAIYTDGRTIGRPAGYLRGHLAGEWCSAVPSRSPRHRIRRFSGWHIRLDRFGMGGRLVEQAKVRAPPRLAMRAGPQDVVHESPGRPGHQGSSDYRRYRNRFIPLSGNLHADPGDRLIIATARHLGMPIVTSDRKILAYAEAGFVRAIPCST